MNGDELDERCFRAAVRVWNDARKRGDERRVPTLQKVSRAVREVVETESPRFTTAELRAANLTVILQRTIAGQLTTDEAAAALERLTA